MVSDETLQMRVEGAIGRELRCQYWGTSLTGETEAQYMTRIVLAEVDVEVAVFRDGFEAEHLAWAKSENEIDRMAQQIVKLSLTQDRRVQDLATLHGTTTQYERNYYGIEERSGPSHTGATTAR